MNDTSNNFNVAVLGYKASIKSSFLQILQKETSYLFFGSNILKANLDIGNRNYEIKIIDTPSGINYRFFNIDFYFMNKLGFLIIYDISDSESFLQIPKLLDRIMPHANQNTVIMIIGIFFELPSERVVLTKDAYEFAINENILFTEASKDDVFYSFKIFIEEICKKHYKINLPKNYLMDYSMLREVIHEQNLIDETKIQKNDKFFIYENKKYPFNFYSMKKHSIYIFKNKEKYEKYNEINLFNGFGYIKNISPESIQLFIEFTKKQQINITNSNVIEIYSLSIQFEVPKLINKIESYLKNNYNEVIKDFLKDSSNLINKFSYAYECFISKNLVNIIEDNNYLHHLPISFLYRVILKCSFKDKNEEKKIEDFIIKIIKKNGPKTYSLFTIIKIGNDDPEFLKQLLVFSYEISDTGPLIAKMISDMKSEINEMKDKVQVIYNAMTSATISPEKTVVTKRLFQSCKQLREVNIPPTVTLIDDYAFDGCMSLVQISLPSSLKRIGDFAFHGCMSLLKISIPSNVMYIGNNAFEECNSLKQVLIPKSVSRIYKLAFANCKTLKQFTISSTSTNIENDILLGCSQLKELVIPLEYDYFDLIIDPNIKIIKKNEKD